MKTRFAARHAFLALTSFTLLASPALAGGPLANCSSGVPFRWPAGGVGIPWNPDQGTLGPLSNADAVTAVDNAFQAWQAIPFATATYLNAGALPVDVNITNFAPFLDAPAPDGLSAIVFDANGEIFTLLFGANSGILGFAGPEWADPATCTILEGLSFLNGPAFSNAAVALDVMVHEFGHYSNVAHTAVNGQIILAGDATGPTPNNTFPPPPSFAGLIETMYPFYFGPAAGTSTPERDDVSAFSALYPEPTFAAATATISGTIFATNGVTRLSGVNVIARNVADPFVDAVSALSGDRTDGIAQTDPLVGTYHLAGLTPGAQYAVFVDQILAGGFSTPPRILPAPEEFHNGAAESSNSDTDDPSVFTPVSAAAGGTASGINVIFNTFQPGDPLPVGDDGSLELALPFSFSMCGQQFSSVFVNANGNVTFGSLSQDFSETVPEFLGTQPRIAGVWDDLDASAGGRVTFDQTADTFSVIWESVPEFVVPGSSNSFTITLHRASNRAEIEYGSLSATDGLAGLSCGGAVTSGFENEMNLRPQGRVRTVNMNNQTAAFEIFTAGDPNDLDGVRLNFVNFSRSFNDTFERNNTLAQAKRISLPFDTVTVSRFTKIDPVGADADYFRFSARAGDILAIETVRGAFDTTLGVFDATTGALLAANDDGGAGLLSRLLLQVPADIELAVAVSAFPDLDDFDGDGEAGGRYVLVVNRYRGTVLAAGDDTSTPVDMPFRFRFQGQNYRSVFVNSNGNLTFGAEDTDFTPTVPELLAGPPRIAPLWDDLDPRFGVVVAGPGVAASGLISFSIHYISVPEFGSDSPNYFTVHLFPLEISAWEYGATARSNSLVGMTQGGGADDPGETDLSAMPLQFARGTIYEVFDQVQPAPPEPFDLSFDTLLWLPFILLH